METVRPGHCSSLRWWTALSGSILLCLGMFQRQACAHGEAPGPANPASGVLPYALSFTPCNQGYASIYPCRSLDLLAYLPLDSIGGGGTGNDVWGWTAPSTGREFVLFGKANGTAFVEITDPTHPIYLGDLPTASSSSLWRDIKVWGSYALVVSEAPFHGMQVFDLRRLLAVTNPPQTFSADSWYTRFSNAHNVVVNEETGFAYAVGTNTCNGGLHMIDLREPLRPAFAGCFAADGYTHDAQCVVYRGPEPSFLGRELCFCANEDTLTIVDVTDKQAPRLLARADYAGRGYAHQGWLTPDHTHFLLDDEFDETLLPSPTRTYVWDVTNPVTPYVRDVFVNTTLAIDHNQYIQDRDGRWFVFEANYRSGLRVLELVDRHAPRLEELGFFDIYPIDDNPAYNGAWSVYPFFPSGTIAVSGIEQGLFLLRLSTDESTDSGSAATPTATPTPSPTAPPPPPTPTVEVSGRLLSWGTRFPLVAADVLLSAADASLQVTSDASGQFQGDLPASLPIRVEPLARGNLGSALSASDAVMVLRFLVGLGPLSLAQQFAADANGDGQISASDAVHILRYLVGSEPELRATQRCLSEWVFVPSVVPTGATPISPSLNGDTCVRGAVRLESVTSDAVAVTFEALPFGDVNASWRPASGTCVGPHCTPQDPELFPIRVGRPRPHSRGRHVIPLVAARTGRLAAFQVTLPDPAQLGHFVRLRRSAKLRDAVIVAHVGDDRALRVAGARASQAEVAAGDELGWLIFHRAGAFSRGLGDPTESRTRSSDHFASRRR